MNKKKIKKKKIRKTRTYKKSSFIVFSSGIGIGIFALLFYLQKYQTQPQLPSLSLHQTSDVLGTTIQATDTFQRPDQTYWGTASDGQTWSSDANTNNKFSISNNSGKVTNIGSSAYNGIIGASVNDADVLFQGSLSTYSSANIGSVIRWTDTNNWYKALIDGGGLHIEKKLNGTITTLTSTSFNSTAGINYSLRFQAIGTTLQAKVWETADPEPTNWMVRTTDSTFSFGHIGLRTQTGSGTSSYTYFTAINLSSSPTQIPTPTPSPSPKPTNTPTPTSSPYPTQQISPTDTPVPVDSFLISDTPTPTHVQSFENIQQVNPQAQTMQNNNPFQNAIQFFGGINPFQNNSSQPSQKALPTFTPTPQINNTNAARDKLLSEEAQFQPTGIDYNFDNSTNQTNKKPFTILSTILSVNDNIKNFFINLFHTLFTKK